MAFDGESSIHLASVGGGQEVKVASAGGVNVLPGWTRDGKWIFYTSNRTGPLEIWRIPAAGGEPQQITRKGAFEAKASLDGKLLFYSKGSADQSTLWQVPVDGGPETPVAGLPELIARRQWDVTASGIVYLRKGEPAVRFFDFKTRKSVVLFELDKMLLVGNRNLAVSPDGRKILWGQVDIDTRDISILDHFR